MNIRISINNTTRAAVNERLVKKAIKAVLGGEQGLIRTATRVELSVAFVTPQRIRKLNKEYRRHDSVTDVLSFAENEGRDKGCGHDCDCYGRASTHSSNPVYLGELVICLTQVKLDARELKISVDYELAWVIVHGTLHLLGYDHETDGSDAHQMRAKEKFYLSKLKINLGECSTVSASIIAHP